MTKFRSGAVMLIIALVIGSAFVINPANAQVAPKKDKAPVGTLDAVSCEKIEGWTFDSDTVEESLSVHLYYDGPAGSGKFLTSGFTEVSRSDVNAAYGITGNHGFSITTPSLLKDGSMHAIYAYGINSDIDGVNTLLNNPQKIQCTASSGPIPPITNPPDSCPLVLVNGVAQHVCDPIIGNVSPLPSGRANALYAPYSFTATSGTGIYTWAVTTGSLPPGLSLDGGVLSGAPTLAGTYNFTVTVTSGTTASKDFALTVEAAATEAGPSLTVSSPQSGSSWRVGSKQKITWSDSSPGTNPVYNVKLVNKINQTNVLLGTATNAQELDWQIGEGTSASISPAADYFVEVTKQSTNPIVFDVSDGTFTIEDSLIHQAATGYLDMITPDGYLLGWAIDLDHKDQAVSIHIYLDGPAGSGQYLTAMAADSSRPDVNVVMGASGNHGFRYRIPDSLRDGNSHSVYVHVIDLDDTTGHSNSLLVKSGQRFALKATTQIMDHRHDRGSVVLDSAGTVWFLGSELRYAFPNGSVFLSWGHDWADIVIANEFDLALPIGPTVEIKS